MNKIVIAPIEVITDRDLSEPERRVLLILYSFKGKSGESVFPSIEVVAEMAGYADKTRISKITKSLEVKGWLTKKRRGFTGGNSYVLLSPYAKLESEANLDLDTNAKLEPEANTKLASDAKYKEQSTEQTIEQPIINPEKSVAVVEKKARASRLPADWIPTQDYWDAAVLIGDELNIDMRPRLKQIAHKFKDYWIAKSGSGATKLDWLATWRNWIRREAENAKGGIGTIGKKSYGEQRAELFESVTDYGRATDF